MPVEPVGKEAHRHSAVSRQMKSISKCLQSVLNTGHQCIWNASGIFPKHFYEYCGCGDVCTV